MHQQHSSTMDSSALTETEKREENRLTESELRRMLPASFRNGPAWVGIPHNRVQHFLKDDLNIERLEEASTYFSILGKAKPPQALHHQQALGLEILVTEKMDTHLLWTKGKIFIKPFPRYLLDPEFWSEQLECPKGCAYASEFQMLRAAGLVRRKTRFSKRKPCSHSKLWKCAMGFVYSYIALISHESDFRIAKASKLLPDDMDFKDWQGFVERTLRKNGKIHGQIDERFTYGELNMARLNTLLMLQQPRRYLFQDDGSYGFLRDHTSLLSPVSVYTGVVLASVQVRPTIANFKRNRPLTIALVILLVSFWVLYSVLSITGKGLPTIAGEQ
ncbi:hypothetical protein H0G86_000674 [Trichoderma simmonsii]|uniref:Uncharacterized protein n=1 Tax=Trichoderma simmonsii TaxID=1491479 RepID=A0A8G0L023_9HYPO|nr:hypothetical protein H0G86_000674 [Trichoderma simmonsii]